MRGQVQMWANYLRGGNDLFAERYAHLEFGELLAFELPVGLDDNQWLARVRKASEPEEPEGEGQFAA